MKIPHIIFISLLIGIAFDSYPQLNTNTSNYAMPQHLYHEDLPMEEYCYRLIDDSDYWQNQKLKYYLKKYDFSGNSLIISEPNDMRPYSFYQGLSYYSLYSGLNEEWIVFPDECSFLTIPYVVEAVEPRFCVQAYFENMSLPGSVEIIYEYGFSNAKFNSLILSEGLKRIHNSCLVNADCNEIRLPNSLYHIGSQFMSGSSMKNVAFGNSLRFVDKGCFNNCRNLEEALLPERLQTLMPNCFNGCSNLKIVSLPKYLLNTKELTDCFNSCPEILKIECKSSNPLPFKNCFNQVDKENCLLVVPDNSREKYASTQGWKEFFNIIEESEVTSVEEINLGDYQNSGNPSEFYTIDGLRLSSEDQAPSGEFIIVKNGDKIEKKIKL